jgi:hypothetical protein
MAEPHYLSLAHLEDDPHNVLEFPLPPDANPELLHAARAAAVSYVNDLGLFALPDPVEKEVFQAIQDRLSDIGTRLGDPEPVPKPTAESPAASVAKLDPGSYLNLELLEDPENVLEFPLPPDASTALLKAGRDAALSYPIADDIPSFVRNKLEFALEQRLTEIRHRLGDPEPEPKPLEPEIETALDELEKKWNADRPSNEGAQLAELTKQYRDRLPHNRGADLDELIKQQDDKQKAKERQQNAPERQAQKDRDRER